MRITVMSDLHGLLVSKNDLPEGDLIIFCGDICPNENHCPNFQKHWIETFFIPYLNGLKYKYKILVYGNHDFVGIYNKSAKYIQNKMKENGVTILSDSSITYEGIVFYGTPYTPTPCNAELAFNENEEMLEKRYEKIPDNTNILISHGPPFGILDKEVSDGLNLGSKSLLERINKLKNLKIICFGHIHGAYGIYVQEKVFLNCSINSKYIMNKPITLDFHLADE